MEDKKILILSEAFGAGHTKAAEALKEGMRVLYPGCHVEVIELGNWLRPLLSQIISIVYLKTLRYSPKLWGVVYRKARHKPVKKRYEFILHKMIYSQITTLIERINPDVIICTHPFPSAVISRLKRMGVQIPLYSVITDYAAHGSWINTGVDKYFLPSATVWDKLYQMGIPEEKLIITGIPTHPKFWIKEEKEKVRKQLGLPSLPTVLCMGGGLGIGFSEKMLQVIYEYRHQMQIIFITGKNKALYEALQKNPEYQHPNFHLLPFVENIDQLMDASDILITKPGGITCTEAISKQIPLILINPLPGQEEDNTYHFMSNRLGYLVKTSQELDHLLNTIFQQPSILTNQSLLLRSSPYSGNEAISIITRSIMEQKKKTKV